MHILATTLSGPLLIAPEIHGDDRGFFIETYRQNVFEQAGIPVPFVQDNHSRSRRGIVRGMHYQPGQAKLVRCVSGAILDVLVDIRPGSAQFGQWESFVLDDSEHRQLYCPDGFAHGFCVLSERADVIYSVSAYWDPQLESGFAFDDPDVAIEWPGHLELECSVRDRDAPHLADRIRSLPYTHAERSV
jgi:dTDP-4-dehydrorhamnose 3,5-epimerase